MQHTKATKTREIQLFLQNWWMIPKKQLILFTSITLLSLQIYARGLAQPITLWEKNVPIEKVFKDLEEKYGYSFVYTHQLANAMRDVTIDVTHTSITNLLKELFKDQPVTYSLVDKVVVINIKPEALQKGALMDIKGRVVNEAGAGIYDATVMIKGTVLGVKTDNQGNFNLPDVPENAILVITSVGYTFQEVPVNNRTYIEVILQLYTANLDEITVVNTGYQKIAKDRITGAIDLISAKDIQRRSQLNVLDRLEGQVPGLLIMNGRDNGEDDAVTLRGVSTLYATKRPLIVVDNFPIEGDINSINPNDVAYITVLKDAAAASIWGARAANGVIVITTKNGRRGKVAFTYRNSFQFSPKSDLTKMNRLGAADDIRLQKLLMKPEDYNSVVTYDREFNQLYAYYFDSLKGRITPAAYADKVAALSQLDNTDQIKKYLMNTPFTQSHTLSASGGNEIAQFYGSLLYNNTKGQNIREMNNQLLLTLKNNINITKRMYLGTTVSYSNTYATGAPVKALDVFNYKPYSMIADEQGNPLPVITNGDDANQVTSNIYTIATRNKYGLQDETFYPLKEIDRRDINNRSGLLRIQGELGYKIIPGIEAVVSYQYENSNSLSTDFLHRDNYLITKLVNDFVTPKRNNEGQVITHADGTIVSPLYNIPVGGRISETRRDMRAYTLRALINVDKNIAGNSHVAATIGGERSVNKYTGNNITRYGYDDNTLQSISMDERKLASGDLDVLRTYNRTFGIDGNNIMYLQNNTASFFGTAAYTYRAKYIVSGSARIDATNLFGTNPKYLYKPSWSVGATWLVSQENFLQNTIVSHLGIRATYGLNGNIPKNSGPFMLATGGTNFFTSQPSNSIYSPANNQLRWEPTYTTNIGVDFDLKKILFGKIDWYNRKSIDVLSDYGINPTYGFSTLLINAGVVTNKGFEVQITTRNIDRADFAWATSFVFARNKNNVEKISTPLKYSEPYQRASANGKAFVQGYPYGSLFSYKFAGLDKAGQIQVLNEKGDTVLGNYDDDFLADLNVLAYSGSNRPMYTGALGNTIRYKNLELYFNFVYYGSYSLRRAIPSFGKYSVNSSSNILKDAWMKPGDEKTTQIPSLIINPDYSSYYGMVYYKGYLDANVFDASYIKLRDVILTYNLPGHLLQHKYITAIQLSAQARNIYTWTKNKFGYDPETFSVGRPGVPLMPTYIFGVNVSF